MTPNNSNYNNATPNNPRHEANQLVEQKLGEGYQALVLEPSPPASTEPPWFADDPARVSHGSSQTSRKIISPTSGATITSGSSLGDDSTTWNELCQGQLAEDTEFCEFARSRWLGAYARLADLPANYEKRRIDAHRLAFGVISEVRRRAQGAKFGLRYVQGGYGTPFFVDSQSRSCQVRVVGGEIIFQVEDDVSARPISTLRQAADFLGVEPVESQREHDSPELGEIDEELSVDAELNDFLGNWYGCSTAALEEVRSAATDADATRVQMWPGHFDVAMDLGDGNNKGTFGASPGDGNETVPPYLYVTSWAPDALPSVAQESDYWSARTFTGAVMLYEDILATASPYEAMVDFFRQGYKLINY